MLTSISAISAVSAIPASLPNTLVFGNSTAVACWWEMLGVGAGWACHADTRRRSPAASVPDAANAVWQAVWQALRPSVADAMAGGEVLVSRL